MFPDAKTSVELIFQDFEKIPFLYIGIILFCGFLLTIIIKRSFPTLSEKLPPRFRHYLLPLVPLLRLLVMIISVLLIIPTVIRPSLQNIVAIFGTVGLALGFAFKDFASSIIAGIIAIYEQPYRLGDRVTIDGIYGEVQAINLRSLRINTPEDTMVTIPHSKIWNGSILNSNDGNREQLCVADFYLAPEHDSSRVRNLLRDVALASPYTLFRRPVAVLVHERPFGTHYQIKAYPIDGRDQFAYISDLTVKGRAAITQMGLSFATAPVSVVE